MAAFDQYEDDLINENLQRTSFCIAIGAVAVVIFAVFAVFS